MPSRNAWRAWILGLLAGAGGAACAPSEPPAVGVALSGAFVNATRMALADAIASGLTEPVDTLLFAEATNSAQPAIAIAERFVGHGSIIAVVGHSNSAASLAAAPLYNGAGIVQIAPTSTAARYSEAGTFSFRLAPADQGQGELLAAAIEEGHPGGATVGVLYVNDDYGRSLRSAVLSRLDSSQYPVAIDWPHNDEDMAEGSAIQGRLITDLARTLRVARPRVLLLLGRSDTIELLLPAIRRTLPGVDLIGGDALGPGYWRTAEVPEWVGVRFADFLDLDRSVQVQAFRRRYEERYGIRARAAEVLSYDAMGLVLAGIAEGAVTGPALRDWLLSLGRTRPAFQGLSGPIQFDASGDIVRPFILVAVPPRS